ncbi:hypothetical protein SDC9_154404 [bioreactor metagenome]|uniref:Uncharacterized protein n=2 Tax=root TaxID=1 RepID=A0A645EYL0_9ZZZZ
MLNLALWACTAKQWREANPENAKKGLNIRDTASINELVVLANLESFNAELLKRDMDKSTRYTCLHEMAERQLTRLNAIDAEKGCGVSKILLTFGNELFDSIAPQNAENSTVTNSLPLKFKNSAKGLFFNRLSQTDDNLK